MKRSLQFAFIVFCLFCNTKINAQGSAGLIAHWDMNGSSADVSGNGHTGHTVNVTPAVGATGAPNTAYSFSGTNSYISAANAADLNIKKYTICVTLQPRGFNSGTCQGNWVFGRGNFSGATVADAYGLGFTDNAYNDCTTLDTTLEGFNGGAGTNTPALAASWQYTPHITSFNWLRVVLVYDSLNWKLFVNHVLVNSVTGDSTPIANGTDSILIGQNMFGTASGYPYNFKGLIDDIMLYGRALSDSEAVHYGDTCGRINTQPVAASVHKGSNTTFTVNTAMVGATYQWQEDAGSGFVNLTNTAPYSGVTTNILSLTSVTASMNARHYRCILNNTWVCTDTSASVVLNVTNVNVNDVVSADQIFIFPNPGNNLINIEMPSNVLSSFVQVINQTGQVVAIDNFSGIRGSIDISKLPAGIYFLKISGADYSVYKRLLKN